MKEIMINGYPYFLDQNNELYMDKDKTYPIDKKFLTTDERKQLDNWIYYSGKPMYSYY